MIAQTLTFAVLLLIMWTIVILLVWHDAKSVKKEKGKPTMNNDLISRSALLEMATNATKYDEGGWGIDLRAVPVEEVLKAPAIDAVEVVRCKDCKHCSTNTPDGLHWCDENEIGSLCDDDFCSYGERRADNAD